MAFQKAREAFLGVFGPAPEQEEGVEVGQTEHGTTTVESEGGIVWSAADQKRLENGELPEFPPIHNHSW